MNPRARDKLRQHDENIRPTFEPTISVERRIIIDGEVGEEYQAKLNENLKKTLPRNRRRHYRVLDPNTLCLRLVDNAPIEPKYAQDIAKELDYRLVDVINKSPQFMALPVGRVACFKELNPIRKLQNKYIVGAEPVGWRGPDARYQAHDKSGARTPIGLLVGESEICTRVLGKVVKTPYVPLAINSRDISPGELRAVEEAANETFDALPEEGFQWQDPQIILRTGPARGDVEVFDVRAPVFDLAA